MLLTTVAVGLLLQSPQGPEMKPWVDQGFDPGQPNAYMVAGSPELSRNEAVVAVQRHAREDHAGRLRELAEAQAKAAAPGWLPGFVRDRVVREWTRDEVRRVALRILDEDVIVRDHGFGRSYQAFLLVDPADPGVLAESRGLTRRLEEQGQQLLVKTGAMVGLWGLLAFAVLWVDRLTRGYMTRRLYALGTALALVGPVLVVLL